MKGKKLRGLPDCPRMREVVDIGWWHLRKMKKHQGISDADLMRSAWVNVSQCVTRLPTHRQCLPTVLQGTMLYSYEFDCVLSGVVHAQLLGWPQYHFPASKFDDGETRGLIGECFSVPLAGLVHLACVSHASAAWWR
jgi:hypothetical protein